jgi:hypothetical protein
MAVSNFCNATLSHANPDTLDGAYCGRMKPIA